MTGDNPWLPSNGGLTRDGITQLLCFPHAGGGSAGFHRWEKRLPGHLAAVPIKLPGRESRFNEVAHDQLDSLLSAMVPQLIGFVREPVALFGHSMGALIAYELARHLHLHHDIVPTCLFVSACRSPDRFKQSQALHRLPTEEMIRSLVQDLNDNGTASNTELDMMRMMSDTIRADLKLLETYEYQPRDPLPFPIVALAATRDRKVTVADVNGWRAFTTARFTMRTMSGHHFFLRDQEAAVTDLIAAKL